MQQLNLALRFPMDEQLQLPLDYSDCAVAALNGEHQIITIAATNGMVLMHDENYNLYWAPNIKKLQVDEIVVRNPFASIGKTIVQFFKKIFKAHN